MIQELKAAVELDWRKEYYTVEEKEKRVFAPCVACDNTGRVTIKGEEYTCPRCNGNWREKEIVGVKKVFSVGKWVISSITTEFKFGKEKHKVRLERINGERKFTESMVMDDRELESMIKNGGYYTKKVYGDIEEAMKEVKRKNREQRGSVSGNG